jgi:hypothetical protein
MTKMIQWVSVVLALCAAVASQVDALRSILPATAVTVILVITNIVSATLPSLLAQPSKSAGKTLPSLLCLAALLSLTGCAALQPAKPVVNAAQQACESGIVDAALVLAKAQAERITPQQAAEIVCAAVGVADAYYDAEQSGTRESAQDAAIRQAQKVGAL